MEKDLRISVLLDFYGEMLTEKQREVIELYYNEDLSLGEIAQLSHITRQGVRDSIKRGEAMLLEFEEKLKVAEKFRVVQEGLDSIAALAQEIEEYNNRNVFSRLVEDKTEQIQEIVGRLAEQNNF